MWGIISVIVLMILTWPIHPVLVSIFTLPFKAIIWVVSKLKGNNG